MEKTNPTPARTEHELNANESAMLAAINQTALGIKARLFDLDAQRAQSMKELEMIQRQFDGAVGSMGASHDIQNARVTPDFRRIVRGE